MTTPPMVKRTFFDGLDPELLPALHQALDQIHEQILAQGTRPRPAGRQADAPATPARNVKYAPLDADRKSSYFNIWQLFANSGRRAAATA